MCVQRREYDPCPGGWPADAARTKPCGVVGGSGPSAAKLDQKWWVSSSWDGSASSSGSGREAWERVYRAFDERLQRHVAVKEIAGADARRVVREAQAAARLNHPGIVTLYELGSEGDRALLVSELVEGATLAELARVRGSQRSRDRRVRCGRLRGAGPRARARGGPPRRQARRT